MAKPQMMPAVWEHCVTVYEAASKEAKRKRVDGQPVRVFEGFVTHLFGELQIPVNYYAIVTRTLKDMGCLTLIRKGARKSPSQWVLHKKPTQVDFRAAYNKPSTKGATKVEQLEQDIRDLKDQIPKDLPSILFSLVKQNKNQEGRIKKLEKAK